MKKNLVKGAIFLCGFAWVVLTGTGGATWPVVVIPVLLLLWVAPSAQVPPALDDLVIQLKVLNERVGKIDDQLNAIDGQLDRHGEHLAHLVDEQLHALRQRGEIPWPSKPA